MWFLILLRKLSQPFVRIRFVIVVAFTFSAHIFQLNAVDSLFVMMK